MKIKKTKQMRLDELIRSVWKNNRFPGYFKNDRGGEVVFNSIGKFTTDECYISPESTFTVEVEEEVTEETKLKGLAEVYYNEMDEQIYILTHDSDWSIKNVLNSFPSANKKLAIYHGKTLIWSKEHGIPEDGILEV